MGLSARRNLVALPWHQVRRIGAHLSWGLADQGMCSLTNFLLSAYIARSLGATQFGAFALAYVTYGFANNVSRGLSIEPLLVRFSGLEWKWRRATGGCTGTALLVGLCHRFRRADCGGADRRDHRTGIRRAWPDAAGLAPARQLALCLLRGGTWPSGLRQRHGSGRSFRFPCSWA